ncbi:MAG: hypothetical protein IIU78_00340 [Alistipes sp.]|nr:hypothetical protein [Alistipes sp.]
MRKIFTTLKSVVAAVVIASMALAVSCSYDDTAIKKDINQIKNDLAALTKRVAALEEDLQQQIPTLEELLDGKLVIVNVSNDENGNTVLELSNGEKITVLGECKYVPCDHECEPCNCDNLQYRVVDGVLEVSADGQNWVAINGASADQVIANVVLNEDGTVTITLANGDVFTVVKAELIECEATRAQVYVAPGETKSIKFTINDAVSDINIMNQPLGWTASIEVAPAEETEDNVDPGMGILAAGGADFLLNITGPSADFVNAGFAQKEGYVSVHFNSANGGCKVAKVAVNLAELSLSVDASGVITLTNSVAKAAGFDEMGEPVYDFADFFIGIVDAADYATYGDKVFIDSFDDWTAEYNANVASTKRTTGFQNIVDLQWYESGVCEKEVYTLTVDQLAGAFWPKYEYEMGKEYIIFVTTETEMASQVEQPILTNASKASYKRVFVEANLDKESTTWNDATVDFTLAGYNYYIVGWLPVADLQQFIEYGMAADIDSALVFYLKNGGNLMSAGAVVTDMTGTYKLSELAALSMTEWAPMINADTEYLFFVYPMNAETEMDFYTHQVVDENIRNYGTFRTKALVQGEFDAAAQLELLSHEEKTIEVNATFGEDVVSVIYNWYEESFMDPEEAAAAILGDIYYSEFVTFAEGEHSIAASKFEYYGLPDPIYLGILAINANGEYVYVEQSFSRTGEEQGIVLTMSEVDAANGYGDMMIYLSNENVLVALDFYSCTKANYLPEGTYEVRGGSGAIFTGGYSYITFSDGTSGSLNGGSVTVSEVDGKYRFDLNVTYGDDNTPFQAVYEGALEGLVVPSEYVAPEPETLVVSPISRAKYASNKYLQLYSEDGRYCLVYYLYGIVDSNKGYMPAGEYTIGSESPCIYGYGYSQLYDYEAEAYTHKFDEGGVMKVSEVDGAYHIEFNGTLNDGTASMEFVFDGAIENLILPSEYVEPVALEFTPVRAEYDFTYDLYELNGGDSEYAYWLYDANNNYIEVICHYNPNTNWNYVFEGKLVVNGETYELTKISTQQPNNYNCAEGEKYFAIGEAKFSNDTVYSYTGQLPAVEVNYLGEGSNYAPGSENQGGNEGGNEGGDEPVVPGETTELTITSHAFGYTGTMETEVIFMESVERQHIIDFRMTGITAGTYNDADNGIIIGYSKFMYGSSEYNGGVQMDSANATIVDNGDTTFTFDVNFVANGAAYHFTYTTPAQEVNEDVTTVQLVSKGAGEEISYYTACTFADAEGNNSVKLIVDTYYAWDAATDFPKANEYTTWQSSYSYISNGSQFSFVNNSLVVNGVTYANDAVSNAKLTVVEATSVTFEFTVDGNDYKFVYSL